MSSSRSWGDVEQRLPEQDDAVGQLAEAVVAALGEGDAVVQPEQVERAVLRPVFRDEHDVVEPVEHLVGQQVELVDHEPLEGFRIHLIRPHSMHSTSVPWR